MKTEKNLIPFSWDEAQKRPNDVVTRDGRPVMLAGYNPEAFNLEQVVGWVGKGQYKWGGDGTWDFAESNYDLFLKPEAREVFQNVYPHRVMSKVYTSLDAAKGGASYEFEYEHLHPVSAIRLTYIGDDLQNVEIVHRY